MTLVAGRDCGPCTICCKILTIRTPELKKLPGILCEQCADGSGCQIYETRPPICRAWHCGWRQFETLSDDWRPDLSGVLVTEVNDDIPDSFGAAMGIRIDLFASPAAINWPPLVEYISRLMEAGVPVFITRPGPPGHSFSKVLLNQSRSLRDGIARHDRDLIAVQLNDAVVACGRRATERVALD